jgi:hypothetical protein
MDEKTRLLNLSWQYGDLLVDYLIEKGDFESWLAPKIKTITLAELETKIALGEQAKIDKATLTKEVASGESL